MTLEEMAEAIKKLTTTVNALAGGTSDQKDESGEVDIRALIKEGLQEVVGDIKKDVQTSNDQMSDTLFAQEIDKLTERFPAFRDHLNSEDYMGNVILDSIKGIPDFDGRVNTLNRTFKTYVAAASSSGDPANTVSKETAERLKKNEARSDAIKERFLKGTDDKGNPYSKDDFTTDFFGDLENQLAELQGQ